MCLPKIRRARAAVGPPGGDIWLQVDGGVSVETIERCAEAGADVFVAGSAVFGAATPRDGGRAAVAWRTLRSTERAMSRAYIVRALRTTTSLVCSGVGVIPNRR